VAMTWKLGAAYRRAGVRHLDALRGARRPHAELPKRASTTRLSARCHPRNQRRALVRVDVMRPEPRPIGLSSARDASQLTISAVLSRKSRMFLDSFNACRAVMVVRRWCEGDGPATLLLGIAAPIARDLKKHHDSPRHCRARPRTSHPFMRHDKDVLVVMPGSTPHTLASLILVFARCRHAD